MKRKKASWVAEASRLDLGGMGVGGGRGWEDQIKITLGVTRDAGWLAHKTHTMQVKYRGRTVRVTQDVIRGYDDAEREKKIQQPKTRCDKAADPPGTQLGLDPSGA